VILSLRVTRVYGSIACNPRRSCRDDSGSSLPSNNVKNVTFQIASSRMTLGLPLAIFAANFMDRQIVAILVEPIKRDLILSDTEVGLLYGFAFAALYASAGLPIARLADRGDRARIINWSLVLFSLMTAVCGLVTGYWQLLAARIGVAIGEGGTNPPSHSIISDLYPVERRSTAMAVFSLGPHIGILLGFLIGGWVAQLWGWRLAFVVVGFGGLMLATLCFMLLQEPQHDWAKGTGVQPSGSSVFRSLIGKASLCHLFAGAAVFSMAVYAAFGWLPSFLIRSHGLSTATAGTILALILGLFGGLGTLLGGFLADRLGSRNPAWRLQTVAITMIVASFFWAAVFLATNLVAVVILLVVPGGLLGFYLGPTFAMVQSLVNPAMRATAAAFLLLVFNLVGLGAAPLAVGILSDLLTPAARQSR
jgi:predicted MFS family arabinose efflux permease